MTAVLLAVAGTFPVVRAAEKPAAGLLPGTTAGAGMPAEAPPELFQNLDLLLQMPLLEELEDPGDLENLIASEDWEAPASTQGVENAEGR